MTKYEGIASERLAASIDKAITALALTAREGRRCCITCSYFDSKAETCTAVAPPARPPAEVIAFGCPAYELFPF